MRAFAVTLLGGALLAATVMLAAAGTTDVLAELELRQQELFERIGPSVAFVSEGDSFGSGIIVSKNGYILTNAHVVGNRNTVRVVLADGRSFTGRVVARAPDNIDLALVWIGAPGLTFPWLRLAAAPDLKVGAWVASVGHGRGGIWSFNTGMVSNIYPHGMDRPVFQTQIPLNPGNSGGPVVDRRGRVIGVVTAEIKGSNAINFAIRSEVALKSFPQLGLVCECLTITAPKGVPVFVDGKMVGLGPRVIFPAEARTYEVFAVIGGVMKKRRVPYPTVRAVELK
jgi:serine protease Do